MPHDDALLDALLPAREEEATPEDLERAAALCQRQADKARWALYAGLSLHYGSTAERANCVAAALSAAAPAGTVDDELCTLIKQHADAAASVTQLRSSLAAALATAQLVSAVEHGEALLHGGRFGAAAAYVAAVSAAADSLRAADDEGSVLLAYERLRKSLRVALGDALRERVSFQLSGDACGGTVRVRAGPEPLAAVWDGAVALECSAQTVQEFASAAARSAHAAVFFHSHTQAKRQADADGDALAWHASTEGSALTTLLAFLGEAALCADERVRHTFGAALCAAVGAVAVEHLRATSRIANVADWAAQLERAAAFERALAQENLLSHATCPVSAALSAARDDQQAEVRGKRLALARAIALDTSHGGATLVAGSWSGRAADMASQALHSVPPGVACFPACVVSGAALALAALLEERLDAGAHSEVVDAVDVLRACVPCKQADELAAAPGPAMQFRNSAHFLAFVLRNGAAAARASALQGAAAALCSAGDAVLATAVSRAGADAAAALDLADGFNKAGEADRGAAIERALTGALHAAGRFHALACNSLPDSVAESTSREVLHAVGARAADEILALLDIGVDDCSALASAFDAACRAVEVPAVDAPPGWRKLARVRALLDMPLARIVAEAERGEMRGVLSGAEVDMLVCAVFTDSALRADARARIAANNE